MASSLKGDDFVSSLSSNGTFGNYAVNSTCVALSESEEKSGASLAALSIWVLAAAVVLSASLC